MTASPRHPARRDAGAAPSVLVFLVLVVHVEVEVVVIVPVLVVVLVVLVAGVVVLAEVLAVPAPPGIGNEGQGHGGRVAADADQPAAEHARTLGHQPGLGTLVVQPFPLQRERELAHHILLAMEAGPWRERPEPAPRRRHGPGRATSAATPRAPTRALRPAARPAPARARRSSGTARWWSWGTGSRRGSSRCRPSARRCGRCRRRCRRVAGRRT